jgi:hypothetical protein
VDAPDHWRRRRSSTRLTKEPTNEQATDNKAVVGRWFTAFWGESVNLGVIDEIDAPDMLLKYSLREPRRGQASTKRNMGT